MKLQRLIPLLFLICSVPCCAQTYAKNGMVVSDNKLASEVGIDILSSGGNATDAAIATAFALAVTHPQAGNIGGGGFMVSMTASGEVNTIDFREKAPLKATVDMFLDEDGNYIKDSNHKGLKSVGVPGTVAGLYLAHQKYGVLPWKDLVEPAIQLAEQGFPLTWTLHQQAVDITTWPKEMDILQNYFKNEKGEVLAFGETWKQPALARTLKAIRDHGKDGFYKGEVAEKLTKYMMENGGLITMKDLSKYMAIERKPVKGSYKGYDIFSMPPPSSGGVALIEMMNLMELADLQAMEFNSTAYVHFLAESMRRAYADRAEFLGDPDFNNDIPLDRLISKEHAKKRFDNIDFHKASQSDSTKFGHPYDGSNTTHLSVIDKNGNAISMTYTLEHSYGAGMGSPELGFILNNEMGDFNPQPGYTNSGWLIGTTPNIIEPEKRMLSSMCPTIVAKDGRPYLIIGTPGGRTIINTVFQTTLNVLEFEMPIDKAIESMKIHHQWMPDQIYYEADKMSPDTRDALLSMGHSMKTKKSLGRLMGIIYDPIKGIYIGASDSASPDGAAIGY